MRVLVVYPGFYVYGGGEILVVRLCNYLSRNGIKNAILTTEMAPEVKADLINTELFVEPVDAREAQSVRQRYAMQARALAKGIRTHEADFDVVNPHNFPAEIAAASSSKPTVWMCNEPELYLIKDHPHFKNRLSPDRLYFQLWFMRERSLVRKRISRVVVSDEYNADRFMRIYGIKPRIINYGIDYEFFSTPPSSQLRTDLDITGRFVILHVGMITPFKNQLASLMALNQIKQKIPHAMLVCAGGGFDEVYKKKVDKFIHDNNLEGHVVFLGHVTRDELRYLYHNADVMLHPISSQGGWLSPFEMICAGKPVIVSKDLTAASIIEREQIGIVTDNYVEALLDVYLNKEKYRRMSSRGSEYVRAHLSWDRFAEQMLTEFTAARGQL